MTDDRWQDLAACLDAPPELFFPERGEGLTNTGADGKAWCARCPVNRACLLAAIARREKHGLWGGAGEPTRRRLAKLTHPGTAEQHPVGCTCPFCIAVTAHLEAVEAAYTGNRVRHGNWEAYVHAGCRCSRCSDAHRASGRTE